MKYNAVAACSSTTLGVAPQQGKQVHVEIYNVDVKRKSRERRVVDAELGAVTAPLTYDSLRVKDDVEREQQHSSNIVHHDHPWKVDSKTPLDHEQGKTEAPQCGEGNHDKRQVAHKACFCCPCVRCQAEHDHACDYHG